MDRTIENALAEGLPVGSMTLNQIWRHQKITSLSPICSRGKFRKVLVSPEQAGVVQRISVGDRRRRRARASVLECARPSAAFECFLTTPARTQGSAELSPAEHS